MLWSLLAFPALVYLALRLGDFFADSYLSNEVGRWGRKHYLTGGRPDCEDGTCSHDSRGK